MSADSAVLALKTMFDPAAAGDFSGRFERLFRLFPALEPAPAA